jgi:hypothetical protein
MAPITFRDVGPREHLADAQFGALVLLQPVDLPDARKHVALRGPRSGRGRQPRLFRPGALRLGWHLRARRGSLAGLRRRPGSGLGQSRAGQERECSGQRDGQVRTCRCPVMTSRRRQGNSADPVRRCLCDRAAELACLNLGPCRSLLLGPDCGDPPPTRDPQRSEHDPSLRQAPSHLQRTHAVTAHNLKYQNKILGRRSLRNGTESRQRRHLGVLSTIIFHNRIIAKDRPMNRSNIVVRRL